MSGNTPRVVSQRHDGCAGGNGSKRPVRVGVARRVVGDAGEPNALVRARQRDRPVFQNADAGVFERSPDPFPARRVPVMVAQNRVDAVLRPQTLQMAGDLSGGIGLPNGTC